MPCCTIERVEATPFLSRLEEDQQRVRYKYGVLQSLLYVKISKCQSVIQAFNISSVHPIRNIVIMGLFIMNGFIAWNSQKILHLKQDVHTHTHARARSRAQLARTHARTHSRTHACSQWWITKPLWHATSVYQSPPSEDGVRRKTK